MLFGEDTLGFGEILVCGGVSAVLAAFVWAYWEGR
jgi:hypothetical protein